MIRSSFLNIATIRFGQFSVGRGLMCRYVCMFLYAYVCTCPDPRKGGSKGGLGCSSLVNLSLPVTRMLSLILWRHRRENDDRRKWKRRSIYRGGQTQSPWWVCVMTHPLRFFLLSPPLTCANVLHPRKTKFSFFCGCHFFVFRRISDRKTAIYPSLTPLVGWLVECGSADRRVTIDFACARPLFPLLY
jgi:hypothetical protein